MCCYSICFIIFFVCFWGETSDSTFPSVKLEKSREKSPLKKFFSHTFRLLIYLWKRRIVTSDSTVRLWHIFISNFNAVWQMKNFSALLNRFFVLKIFFKEIFVDDFIVHSYRHIKYYDDRKKLRINLCLIYRKFST